MDMDRAMMLHRKECPFDHRCQASDCMECTEVYQNCHGKESEQKINVDGLASN